MIQSFKCNFGVAHSSSKSTSFIRKKFIPDNFFPFSNNIHLIWHKGHISCTPNKVSGHRKIDGWIWDCRSEKLCCL